MIALLPSSSDVYTLLCLLVTTVLLIWYSQYHWKRRHLYKHSKKVPGPKGYPIIGNILDFTGSCDAIYNNISNHFNFSPHLIKVWYGPTLVYAVSKPEYLETVLSSSKALSKMYLYRYAEPVCGHGLFTAPVPVWKRHRKIIMPAFNQKILDGFVDVFGSQSTILCEHLEKHVGEKFNLFEVVSKCSLDIICETAMGVKINAQNDESDVGHCVDRLLEIMFLRMLVIWYHFDFIFKWTSLYQDERKFTQQFNNFTERIIKEKLAAFEQNPEFNCTTKRKAFLDLLIEQSIGENKLTIDEIRDEVNTFMIAGSDTTTTTNCFIFTMLGMHPYIQDRVYAEVVNFLGTDRMVLPEDLPLLKYTERVIKETLRLFPNGPYIVRDIEEDLPLGGDIILPKGSSAILGIIHAHRNSEYWPNPLKFDPDRFLSEEVPKRHSFSYLPFSGGLRNCVGPRYAMMAMKATLATVIRRFKFSTSYQNVGEIKLKTNLVLRPVDGFKVFVEMRK